MASLPVGTSLCRLTISMPHSKLSKTPVLRSLQGPGDRANGQRYFFIDDPDGNRIELATAGYTIDSQRTVDELGFTYDKDGNKL